MEAAKNAGDAKTKATAKAGGSSNISTETQQKLESSGPTGMPPPSGTTDAPAAQAPESGESSAASKADTVPPIQDTVDETSEQETYEGVGSNDPDKEAVVPDSKHTVAVAQHAKSDDPDAEAVVPGSKDTIKVQEDGPFDIKNTKRDDPDAEAVVPGSEATVQPAKSTQAIHDSQTQIARDSKEHGGSEARGKNTVENTTKATAASDDAEDLPGKTTQDQASAKAEEAGVSVAD